MLGNKRRDERVDTYWERSIRLYLKRDVEKHQVRLVNCSRSGVCIEVATRLGDLGVEDRTNLLLQVGDETCAFSAVVKWVGPDGTGGPGGEYRRYGARIDRGTETNAGLYQDYVHFLLLKRRFQQG